MKTQTTHPALVRAYLLALAGLSFARPPVPATLPRTTPAAAR